MAFTYSDSIAIDRDKVRLRAGDTVENEGPRPDGRNFSDGELDFILTDEGSVTAALAQVFEILRAEWAQVFGSEREGEVVQQANDNVEYYTELAKAYRARARTSGSGSITLSRDDAYTGSNSEYT